MSNDEHMMHSLAKKYPGKARKARTGSRANAIQLFCLQCQGGVRAEVESCCSETSCELWPYRIGGFEQADVWIPEIDPKQQELARKRFHNDT